MNKSFEIFRNRTESFSVNLSLRDIEKNEMQEFIIGKMKDNPEIAKRLTIEILEEEGMMNTEVVGRFIDKVKEFGVSVAIDDFGSGYSNFKRLLDLHVDYIKIDGSIIQSILTNPATYDLLQLIVAFSRKEQLPIVAEYVENEEIAIEVKKLGIEYSQGFYFGKPERFT